MVVHGSEQRTRRVSGPWAFEDIPNAWVWQGAPALACGILLRSSVTFPSAARCEDTTGGLGLSNYGAIGMGHSVISANACVVIPASACFIVLTSHPFKAGCRSYLVWLQVYSPNRLTEDMMNAVKKCFVVTAMFAAMLTLSAMTAADRQGQEPVQGAPFDLFQCDHPGPHVDRQRVHHHHSRHQIVQIGSGPETTPASSATGSPPG